MHELTALSQHIQISEKGVIIDPEASLEDWKNALAGLRLVKKVYKTALSELTRFGIGKWGVKEVEATFEALEFDFGDARQALVISSLNNNIAATLTVDHQYVLANNLTNDSDRQKWADAVVEHGLTANDLKRSILCGEVVRGGNRGSQGITSLEAVTAMFIRARKNYDLGALDMNAISHIESVLAPISDFITSLAEAKAELQ